MQNTPRCTAPFFVHYDTTHSIRQLDLVQLGKHQRGVGTAKAKAVGHGHPDLLLLGVERHKVEAGADTRLAQVERGRDRVLLMLATQSRPS